MTSIKLWYLVQFPDDENGLKISDHATFETLYENLPNAYEYIGVDDSIVRERVFVALANLNGVYYDHIYERWLSGPRSGHLTEQKMKKITTTTVGDFRGTHPVSENEMERALDLLRSKGVNTQQISWGTLVAIVDAMRSYQPLICEDCVSDNQTEVLLPKNECLSCGQAIED